ncbi:hypothetical protein DCE93_03305 [Agromyces badenianii]|uniref:Uncharacterized protein n=2 Tax=Agromyces badenianii TaxID=2080742 RepID=A0A2S0WTY7_9MICO|nr:hypothetical protein DCE93_03305 [Agromyces badenianii]PWC03400.1 DUF981 domain-containing protein [Agromyces badenianii]
MITYNTIMSVAAGAGLLTIVWFGWSLTRTAAPIRADAWSLSFAVPGVILFATGLHMTLTWPFATYFPFDNIIFGETSLGFGVLLLAAAFYLWRRRDEIADSGNAAGTVAAAFRPLSIFIIGMGLSLIAIAFAGVIFQLFAAPPEEPISGSLSNYPWIETLFMSALFAGVGLGAVLFPFTLRSVEDRRPTTLLQRVVALVWALTGLAFLLFGALNFFTHIGLIINTMG